MSRQQSAMRVMTAVGLFIFMTGSAGAEIINAESAITQAVVYPSSARVTRVAKLTLKPGTHTVRLVGVQPVFDDQSLSVSGKGTAEVKVLGAGVKTEFIKKAADERVRDLESRMQAVDDELAALNADAKILNEKRKFLSSVRMFTGEQVPKDMVTKVPAAVDLKSTMDFLESGSKDVEQAALALRNKQRDKNQERKVLQQELNQLRSGGGNQQRLLTVELECDKAGDLALEIAYSMNQVGWRPLYDARVEFDKAKVNLSSFAVVRQTTGEDWKDVKLTLSTSRPALGGRMPELNVWTLKPRVIHMNTAQYEPYYMDATAVTDKLAARAFSKSAAVHEAAGSLAAPVPQTRAANMVYAVSDSTGAALVYNAARPVTVNSDGSEVRVPLNVQVLDAALEYAATPKLSPFAYLKSRVTNGADQQLIAGRVNVFLDGTYVGNSDIQKTIAPAEAFDLYLGVDEGVTVKRVKLEEKSDDTLIGMIPSSTKKITYAYKLSMESYKSKPVTLKLFDQVPVAQDDKIKVQKVVSSVKPDTEKYQDREGVYAWTVILQPKEKKEITISYVVEYPKDMNIEGL